MLWTIIILLVVECALNKLSFGESEFNHDRTDEQTAKTDDSVEVYHFLKQIIYSFL